MASAVSAQTQAQTPAVGTDNTAQVGAGASSTEPQKSTTRTFTFPNGEKVVAETSKEAIAIYKKNHPEDTNDYGPPKKPKQIMFTINDVKVLSTYDEVADKYNIDYMMGRTGSSDEYNMHKETCRINARNKFSCRCRQCGFIHKALHDAKECDCFKKNPYGHSDSDYDSDY